MTAEELKQEIYNWILDKPKKIGEKDKQFLIMLIKYME